MKVLITGANGFIGSALISHFKNIPGIEIVGTVKRLTQIENTEIEIRALDVNSLSSSNICLKDIDIIIHTVGLNQVRKTNLTYAKDALHLVNNLGTLQLAERAAKSGVRRLLFISSIKASGDRTKINEPFSINNMGQPCDAYGVSKYEAELGLMRIAEVSNLQVTIIRTPMVYGIGVKGNFKHLINAISSRIPLPLKSITQNSRSMIGIDNLVNFIEVSAFHPRAVNKLFFVSDDCDLSTVQLLDLLGLALGRKPNLFHCPIPILRGASKLIGLQNVVGRLTDNLQVDISDTITQLNWKPPYSIEANLQKLKND